MYDFKLPDVLLFFLISWWISASFFPILPLMRRPHVEYCTWEHGHGYRRDKGVLGRIQKGATKIFEEVELLSCEETLRAGTAEPREKKSGGNFVNVYWYVEGGCSVWQRTQTDTEASIWKTRLSKITSRSALPTQWFCEIHQAEILFS